MLCHSDLMKTKVGFNKQIHYKDAFGVERKDYSGAIYENEYSCTNPDCIFHNKEDIKNAQARIERIKYRNKKNKHVVIAPSYNKNKNNLYKGITKLKERWTNNY